MLQYNKHFNIVYKTHVNGKPGKAELKEEDLLNLSNNNNRL